MNILRKRNILKLAATFMLVAMMAGAFAGHTKAAFATIPCAIGTFIQGSCITTIVPSDFPGDISFSNDVNVTVTAPLTTGPNTFSFQTKVLDQRALGGGWSLQAISPNGLQIGGTGTSIPLFIGGTALPTTSCTDVLTCPLVTSTLTTLTDITTVRTFATAPVTLSPHGGTVTVTTPGSFTIAPNTPPGSYSGTITISLVSLG